MSTITVVKKDGQISIAADTLTTWGRTKESAEYIVNCRKIMSYEENFLGISGSASFQIALEDFLLKSKKRIPLGNISEIFRFGIAIHQELKDNYFLRPDDDEAFETLRADVLIANRHGIFGISEYRYVQEYTKFYAHGSGNEYALGAMFAVYQNEDKTAEEIARLGVLAGIEFDDGSALPVDCYTIKLR